MEQENYEKSGLTVLLEAYRKLHSVNIDAPERVDFLVKGAARLSEGKEAKSRSAALMHSSRLSLGPSPSTVRVPL